MVKWYRREVYVSMATEFDALLKLLEGEQGKANLANQKRYEEMTAIFDEQLELHKPGGSFGAGFTAELESTKRKDVASGAQSLVGAGLYGTTTTAGLGQAWESNVGSKARLGLQDLRTSRYAGALKDKAGAIERVEDTGPDYNTIAQLANQFGQGGGGSGGGGNYSAPRRYGVGSRPSTSGASAGSSQAARARSNPFMRSL